MRNLHLANRAMPVTGSKEFGKLKKQCSEGHELAGKTIGIIGFGRIGQEVARIALGVGMKVVAADPYVPEANIDIKVEGADSTLSVRIVTTDFDELFSRSDIITVHIPKADKPIIGKEELHLLKKGVLLINTSRGGIFDEEALLDGLASGIIGGAALDVFKNEPTPDERLLAHPKISLSPHIGGSTVEAQEKVGVELAQLIINHFRS
jgi:D-3-phosphoglycerate dehydrogenase